MGAVPVFPLLLLPLPPSADDAGAAGRQVPPPLGASMGYLMMSQDGCSTPPLPHHASRDCCSPAGGPVCWAWVPGFSKGWVDGCAGGGVTPFFAVTACGVAAVMGVWLRMGRIGHEWAEGWGVTSGGICSCWGDSTGTTELWTVRLWWRQSRGEGCPAQAEGSAERPASVPESMFMFGTLETPGFAFPASFLPCPF